MALKNISSKSCCDGMAKSCMNRFAAALLVWFSLPALAATVPTAAPTNVTATPGDGYVTLTFNSVPPIYNGGNAITGYKAVCGSQSMSKSDSPIVVAGLANNTSVTCTVAATNGLGLGPASPGISVTPTATITIDSGASSSITLRTFGSGASMQFFQGMPVVSYYDSGNQALKIATCVVADQCHNPASWIVRVVDSGKNVGRVSSLRITSTGNPIISYSQDNSSSDQTIGVKLAVCAANCRSTTQLPVWRTIFLVRSFYWWESGTDSSLALYEDKPVVAYQSGGGTGDPRASGYGLRLATCIDGCTDPATAEWKDVMLDRGETTNSGYYPSLQLDGDRPVISYMVTPDGQSNDALMLYTCLSNCRTDNPTGAISTVSASIRNPSKLVLDGGYPVILYPKANGAPTGNQLTVATCTGACDSANPQWQFSSISSTDNVAMLWGGSLALQGSVPVVSYLSIRWSPPSSDAVTDPAMALCTANCRAGTATWQVTRLRASIDAKSTSLVLRDERVAHVAFEHKLNSTTGALEMASLPLPATVPPGIPFLDAALPTTNGILIKFRPPTSDGGDAVTNYRVTCGSVFREAVQSPILVDGLNAGTSYDCVMTATNTIGTSLPSRTLSATPSAPLSLQAVKSRKVH